MVRKTCLGITTSVYRKPTNTGQYLNYNSNHPYHVKFGIAQSLFTRAIRLSSSEEDKLKEIYFIFEELKKNDYPLKVIHKAYNKTKSKMHNTSNEIRTEEKPTSTVTIPYRKGMAEKIKRINNKFNVRTVFSSQNTIRSFVTKVKPKNIEQETKNVVYKIKCECNSNYYGQTSRPLKIRIQEHKQNINEKLNSASKLSEHVLNNGHKVDWSSTSIVLKEDNWKKRNLKEAACMLIDNNSISQPSNKVSKIFLPLIKNEVQAKVLNSKPI